MSKRYDPYRRITRPLIASALDYERVAVGEDYVPQVGEVMLNLGGQTYVLRNAEALRAQLRASCSDCD